MPVLLRSQLDRSRTSSRATAIRTTSQSVLRPTSADNQSTSHVNATNGSATENRRNSCQSNASISRRTVVSVIDYGNSKATSMHRSKHRRLSKNATLFHQIKFCYRQLHLNYLIPLLIIMLYMVIGAALFLWIEAPADLQKKQSEYENYVHERELLLKRLEEIYTDRAATKRRQRRLFLEEAIDYFHERVDLSFPNTTDWSLTTALYYSGTVFTTIGYGDVACYTVAGRVVTVLYACVGIPLMLITLNDLGKFLYKAINRIVKLCKCRKCCTFFKTKPQQIAPSVSTCYEQDVELGLPNVGRSVSTVQQDSVEFQLSIDADEVMTTDESNEVNLEQELVQPGPPPRMPVMVAVGVTVGWIFFCAALFKVWEANWTYAESCYFMFISLSTIGLGDVAVKRRDLMVICFVFVIVGLSLVSMCINVIQTAIEDVYMKLLMRLLVEYQSKLAEGGDQVDASKGMMKMWGGNHAAKYLMPLLSKDKRMTAMAKVQDEAEAQGIEIPPIFSDLDDDSGMPKILTIDNDRKDSQMSILQAIDHAKHSMLHVPAPPSSSSLSLVCLDAEIQTDNHVYLDKEEQTESTEMRDSGIDTEIRFASYICTAVQCGDGDMERINDETQTVVIEMNSAEVMTYCEPSTVDVVQTDDVLCTDAALQTQLFECLQMETQTDFIDYDYTQKMLIETNETETQTDEIDVTRTNHRVKRARTWARDYRQDQPKRLSPSKIQEESDSSEESLDWNPIDGMHAEKQRPVRDLTRFFDKIRSPKSAEK